MNQIRQKQNEDHFIQLLAAQRQLYDDEKRLMGIWLGVVTVVAIIGTGAIPFLRLDLAYQTLISIVIVVAEFTILPSIISRRLEAARIQEQFDCELLEIPWNTVIQRPKSETIVAAEQRHLRQSSPERKESLRNWYSSEVDGLPLHQARVVCQRQNIWWDSELRREYSRWIYIAVFVLVILLIIIGMIANWTILQFLTGPFLLFFPLVMLGVKNATEHRQAAGRLDELRNVVEKVWTIAKDSKISEAEQESRVLQTEIYHHRSKNPPVFSWFYKRLLNKYEELSNTPGHFTKS